LFKRLLVRIRGSGRLVVEKLVKLGHCEMLHFWTSGENVVYLDPFCGYKVLAFAAAEQIQVTGKTIHVGAV
jgi:hypothetical protein